MSLVNTHKTKQKQANKNKNKNIMGCNDKNQIYFALLSHFTLLIFFILVYINHMGLCNAACLFACLDRFLSMLCYKGTLLLNVTCKVFNHISLTLVYETAFLALSRSTIVTYFFSGSGQQ